MEAGVLVLKVYDVFYDVFFGRDYTEYCFIDLNLVWHSSTHREWKQFQQVCNLTQKEVVRLNSHRRQAKEGILPLEYYQSMNRKVIITKYYADGGAIYE